MIVTAAVQNVMYSAYETFKGDNFSEFRSWELLTRKIFLHEISGTLLPLTIECRQFVKVLLFLKLYRSLFDS